jgi:UTP--glucose-1-phosphate uridylyltransferase
MMSAYSVPPSLPWSKKTPGVEMRVNKAVIVAAGWGTRFLPATKAQPKEMLPLLDKPLIQYAVEEAAGSGIEQVVIVTAPGKRSIDDHFSPAPELEAFLEKSGKTALLAGVRRLTGLAAITYVIQQQRLGLGHAVLQAREAIGNEPFAVLLPDDIVDSRLPVLSQMLNVFNRYKASVLAVEQINRRDSPKYGVIKPEKLAAGVYQVRGLVEKPSPEDAPSQLGIVGRYILMPGIFDAIAATPPGKGGEFEGVRYDTGTPQGWLEAQVAFALKRPDFKQLKQRLRRLLKTK